MKIRGTFTVTGIVQGVRYREAVLRLARDRGLFGFVKNRKNGSVKVVAEGEEAIVKAFHGALRIRSGRIDVDQVVPEYSAAKGRFTRFRIIRGKNISDGELEILERLDSGLDLTEALALKQDATVTAVRTMGGDIKSMDGHIQSMDGHIQSMDGHIQSMDGHITEMDRNIGGHFDRLDKKYDAFGASLSQAAGDIHDMKGDIHEVRSDIHDVKADLHEVAARRKA